MKLLDDLDELLGIPEPLKKSHFSPQGRTSADKTRATPLVVAADGHPDPASTRRRGKAKRPPAATAENPPKRPRGRPPDPLTAVAKDEKLALLQAQRRKIEIQNAQRLGELVEAATVEREWTRVILDLRAGMLAIPGRLATRLAHLSRADLETIDREIRDVLKELSHAND
jgi:hypothetical protein